MPFSRWGALAAALVLTLGAGACSSKSTTSPTTTAGGGVTTTAGASSSTTAAPAGAPNSMAIDTAFHYVPNPATFKVGSTITVTNMGGTTHSLTADDGSFDTGKFDSGSKTITLSKAGTFAIHCEVHSFMHGTIIVTP